MIRTPMFGVATIAFALAAPSMAQDQPGAEREFSRAARSYTACLAGAATAEDRAGSIAAKCLLQETSYRESSMKLRMARGASASDAAQQTEAEIADGLRIFKAAQVRHLASATE